MQLCGMLQVPGTCDNYCPKQEARLFEARFEVFIVFTKDPRQKLTVVVEEPSNFSWRSIYCVWWDTTLTEQSNRLSVLSQCPLDSRFQKVIKIGLTVQHMMDQLQEMAPQR
jgi:hypothetical protein